MKTRWQQGIEDYEYGFRFDPFGIVSMIKLIIIICICVVAREA